MKLSNVIQRYPTEFALAAATVMIAQQVAGKAARDALFLSHFNVVELPKVMIAAALISLLGVLTMSHLLTRFGPGRAVPAAFCASAALFAVERLLLSDFPGLTASVLYLHMTGFGAIVISGFWSLINERFDPHTAKPRIARIAAGAALGGLLGGVLARFVAEDLGFPSMLVLLCALNLVCALIIAALGSAQRTAAHAHEGEVGSGLAIIRGTPYLRSMASLLTAIAVTAALLDYAFKAQAAAHFAGREELVMFFATFYAIAGLFSFLLQFILGPRVLERFGIGPVLAVLPVVIAIGGVLGSFIVTLGTTALLRGAHVVLGNSLFRSAFEVLYAPVPAHAKRPTKTIIDVAADRVGDIIGGGIVLLLLAVAPGLPNAVVVLLGAIVAVIALLLVARLNRGYVEQLAGNLRSGSMSLADGDVLDATTRRILAETSGSAERESVLARIKQLKRDRASTREPLPESIYGGDGHCDLVDNSLPAPSSAQAAAAGQRLAQATADLCSGDAARIRQVLVGDFMDVRLVPHLVVLLDHPQLGEDTRMELRWLVPRVIGQLTDALLDPDQALTVRQRIPAVMEICHNPRVIEGLLHGVADEDFSVRYASARALARMRSRDSSMTLDTESVYAAVRREVGVDGNIWQGRSLGADGGFDNAESTLGDGGSTLSLDHVFTLLGLVLERDALQLALQALSSGDRHLRGTALEYLDNVLPEDLRRALWMHLGLSAPTRTSPGHKRRS